MASSAPNEQAVEKKKAPALVEKLSLLTSRAGPRDDNELWVQRLQQEYRSLIELVQLNKASDSDWFELSAVDGSNGTRWTGKVWVIHKFVRYEMECEFELGPSYPTSPPEFIIAELDGKTAKMYRGGKICMTDHFYPLWARTEAQTRIEHRG